MAAPAGEMLAKVKAVPLGWAAAADIGVPSLPLTICQPAPPVPAEPPPIPVVPFSSQIHVLVPFSHKMSDLPSPLKSPVPAMLQPAPPVPAGPPPICRVPSNSQIHVLLPFFHKMSDLPSA